MVDVMVQVLLSYIFPGHWFGELIVSLSSSYIRPYIEL